ncbi:MAG TPA: prepilin-type N-terminal cleavage/methylation domain-containing protein [Candidatus Eremiobacteraceae bacterium]|nr:prepilin-type N-terminal cleavage/methylation domain-containing protein [Candidatus Eremiobacteraceae bacterium]
MGASVAACCTRPDRGFSLIEAMVAMAVLLIVVLMLVGAVPASYAFTKQDSLRVQAVAAGQSYLDSIRQYVKSSGVITGLPPAPTIAIDEGYGFVSNQMSSPTDNFNMTPHCAARSLFSYDCTVNVAWSANGHSQSVEVETFVASQAGF